jgi:uncharacterized protein (DUF433 family)
MTDSAHRLLGAGIYTISEASRLTRVSTQRIRRWLLGYHFRYAGALHESPAVVAPELPLLDGTLALSFLDLQEVRFVDAFLSRGVSWKTLRITSERGQDLVHHSHPFSSGRFWTDGRNLLLEIAEQAHDSALLDVARNQLELRRIVQPFLLRLDFAKDQAIRWWPMGRKKHIVVDPLRSFGQPIVSKEGVPTAVLARAFHVEQSIASVARWFEVSRRAVKQATEFESKLAA